MKIKSKLAVVLGSTALLLGAQEASATCKQIKDAGDLYTKAKAVVEAETSGGFKLPMWVTVVDETGKVCEVVNTSGKDKDNNGRSNDSWLGSRVISAQKANTANAFSLDGFAISSANLYGLTQPGGSLYGLQHSNPVDTNIAYQGSPNTYGTNGDPLKNKRIGGVNVFGGGLALYVDGAGGKKVKVGAIGVSGDTSCTDHAVAWQIRTALGMNKVPAGFNDVEGTDGTKLGDEMVLDGDEKTANTIQQPTCLFPPAESTTTGVIDEI